MTGDPPFLLGLTGSIGMGKSTAASIFLNLGVPVWDADETVHRIYAKGGSAVGPVGAEFPEALKDELIDRTILSEHVTNDPAALDRLTSIVHPLVAQDRQDFILNTSSDILVFDIPLLFETSADAWLDAIAVVTTNAETQKTRVMARPGMTAERFEFILSRQTPDAEKRKRADYIIPSDTLEGATKAIETALMEIRKTR